MNNSPAPKKIKNPHHVITAAGGLMLVRVSGIVYVSVTIYADLWRGRLALSMLTCEFERHNRPAQLQHKWYDKQFRGALTGKMQPS